jgi:hypothetical protein
VNAELIWFGVWCYRAGHNDGHWLILSNKEVRTTLVEAAQIAHILQDIAYGTVQNYEARPYPTERK